jgi:hypothetical protein
MTSLQEVFIPSVAQRLSKKQPSDPNQYPIVHRPFEPAGQAVSPLAQYLSTKAHWGFPESSDPPSDASPSGPTAPPESPLVLPESPLLPESPPLLPASPPLLPESSPPPPESPPPPPASSPAPPESAPPPEPLEEVEPWGEPVVTAGLHAGSTVHAAKPRSEVTTRPEPLSLKIIDLSPLLPIVVAKDGA